MKAFIRWPGFILLIFFAGSDENYAANHNNLSLCPILHLLEEESIEIALKNSQNPAISSRGTFVLQEKKEQPG